MALKIVGVDSLITELHNTAKRASEGARFAMADGAEEIAQLARDYAPLELGNLEEAIKTDMVKQHSRARAHFTVYVDEDVSAENPEEPSTLGKKVGDYALIMHETSYKLGKYSAMKQASNPEKMVGTKFLERAVLDLEDKITQEVADMVNVRVGK